MWVFIVRWSRVALAIAVFGLSASLIQADNKLAQLEREAPYAVEVATRNSARLTRLEAEMRRLRGGTPQLTTTTETTTPAALARRKATPTTNQPGSTTTHPGPDQVVVPPKPSPPPPCAVIVPFGHQCIMVNVAIGPLRVQVMRSLVSSRQ